jgi:K+/H+ antiporter YhaU regulatory subunit KhtT
VAARKEISMPVLQLTTEEADELHTILNTYFSELRMEIERTENGDFRHQLQARERLVRKLIGELNANRN